LRAILQRVKGACIKVDHEVVGSIKEGWYVLLGVHQEDSAADADWLAKKILTLRCFDENGNTVSATDANKEILVASQFTLFASTKKGSRPFYGDAARPDQAEEMLELFMENLRASGLRVESGVFGAYMQADLQTSGPITLALDSKVRC